LALPPYVGERVKGEKRPRLPSRDVHDMLRTRRKRKVQSARRREVFSSEDRLAMKSLKVSKSCVCQVSGASAWGVSICGSKNASIALLACDSTALNSSATDSPRMDREVLEMACKKLDDATVAEVQECSNRWECLM